MEEEEDDFPGPTDRKKASWIWFTVKSREYSWYSFPDAVSSTDATLAAASRQSNDVHRGRSRQANTQPAIAVRWERLLPYYLSVMPVAVFRFFVEVQSRPRIDYLLGDTKYTTHNRQSAFSSAVQTCLFCFLYLSTAVVVVPCICSCPWNIQVVRLLSPFIQSGWRSVQRRRRPMTINYISPYVLIRAGAGWLVCKHTYLAPFRSTRWRRKGRVELSEVELKVIATRKNNSKWEIIFLADISSRLCPSFLHVFDIGLDGNSLSHQIKLFICSVWHWRSEICININC